MASISKPFITLDELKCHLPIREGNVDFDDRLLQLIKVATLQIEQALKRKLTKQEHVQFFTSRQTVRTELNLVGDTRSTVQALVEDYHDQGVSTVSRPMTLTLQSFPIDTVAEFEVIYDPLSQFVGNQSFFVIDPSNYVVDQDKGTVQVRFPMRYGRRRLRVRFTGGFVSAGDVGFETLSDDLATQGFEDLKLACAIQAVFLHKKLDRDNVAHKKNQKQGGTPVDFWKMGGITPEAASLLTSYKALLKGAG